MAELVNDSTDVWRIVNFCNSTSVAVSHRFLYSQTGRRGPYCLCYANGLSGQQQLIGEAT
jgi:hypothetical protein